jgi:cysteine-rich repeat protein
MGECKADCGDGIKVVEEQCDDGNNLDNDGCSSTCLPEIKYFCADTLRSDNLTTSNCTKCINFCDNCSNLNDCDQCTNTFIYTDTNGVITCEYDCTSFVNCKTCDPNGCLVCNMGYTVNSLRSCIPICGDGIVRWE